MIPLLVLSSELGKRFIANKVTLATNCFSNQQRFEMLTFKVISPGQPHYLASLIKPQVFAYNLQFSGIELPEAPNAHLATTNISRVWISIILEPLCGTSFHRTSECPVAYLNKIHSQRSCSQISSNSLTAADSRTSRCLRFVSLWAQQTLGK